MIYDYCNSRIMEYQKVRNLLDNTSNQQYKFKTVNYVDINDDTRGMYKIERD